MNLLKRTGQKAAHALGIGPKATRVMPVNPLPFAAVRESARFKKAQQALDEATRVVHQAKNERELSKAIRLMGIAQKTFDAAFKAHRQE